MRMTKMSGPLIHISNKQVSTVMMWILKDINARYVLDCTYGRGGFYAKYKPRFLVGIDPIVYEHYIVKPHILIPWPVWYAKTILEKLGIEFDTCVIDPPFRKQPRGQDNKSYLFNMLGSPDIILRESIKLCSQLRIPNLVIHYKEIPYTYPYHSKEIIEYKYEAGYLKAKSYFIIAVLDGD